MVMKPGAFDGHRLATFSSLLPDRTPFDKQGLRFNVEVVLIEVENRGRSAVTIQDISLDLGRVRWWSTGRRTVSFVPLKFQDCKTERKIRLEPYDSFGYLLNANHALWAIRRDCKGRLAIRASVRVAGKRPARSPWRKRWKFPVGCPPRLWLDEPFDLAREVYRYLYRLAGDEDSLVRLALPELSMRIAELVESGGDASTEQIGRIIEDCLRGFGVKEPIAAKLWSYDLAGELMQKNGGVFDSSQFGRRRLARGSASQLVPLQAVATGAGWQALETSEIVQKAGCGSDVAGHERVTARPHIRPPAPNWPSQ